MALQAFTAWVELKRENYICMITFRRNGEGVPTPVCFAEQDGVLYVGTDIRAGKLARVRETPRVSVAACRADGSVTGNYIEATARVLETSEEIEQAERALTLKYRFKRILLYRLLKGRRFWLQQPPEERAYIAIEPLSY